MLKLPSEWLHADMINMRPSERSDNGMLTSVQYKLGTEITYEAYEWFWDICQAHEVREGVYAQAPWKPEDPASHDNNTAMLAFAYRFGILTILWDFKILGQHWHPRDLIFYNYLKAKAELYHIEPIRKVLGYVRLALTLPFWPLMIVFQLASCLKRYKRRPHGTFIHTDGKLLAWVRCKACKELWIMRISWHLCKWAIKLHKEVPLDGEIYDISTFQKIFDHYYVDAHPNRSWPSESYEVLDYYGTLNRLTLYY